MWFHNFFKQISTDLHNYCFLWLHLQVQNFSNCWMHKYDQSFYPILYFNFWLVFVIWNYCVAASGLFWFTLTSSTGQYAKCQCDRNYLRCQGDRNRCKPNATMPYSLIYCQIWFRSPDHSYKGLCIKVKRVIFEPTCNIYTLPKTK